MWMLWMLWMLYMLAHNTGICSRLSPISSADLGEPDRLCLAHITITGRAHSILAVTVSWLRDLKSCYCDGATCRSIG